MTTKNTHNEAQDPGVAIESAINKSEEFLQKNSKNLLVALGVIIIVVGGYFGYKYLYATPRAQKASEMMFVAEQQFAVDSFALALNGDGNNPGFLEVISKYGSTPQGNMANHYAGICYLNIGDMANAIKSLEKYKTTSGAPNSIINAQNIGLQADILSQEGKYKEAVEKYNKAIEVALNSFSAPYYLKKSGLVYEKLGDTKAAITAYQRIADDYPSSMEARDIQKYIGAAEQK